MVHGVHIQRCEAASRSEVQILHHLVSFGVSVDSGDYDNRTALHLASTEGKLEVVDFLISARANVNIKDRWSGTPLQDAVYNCHRVVAQLLWNEGPPPKKKQPTTR